MDLMLIIISCFIVILLRENGIIDIADVSVSKAQTDSRPIGYNVNKKKEIGQFMYYINLVKNRG